MISVHLLASCFTLPQNIKSLTLPSGWYDQKSSTSDPWLNTRLVSSLRQQTQWKHSPAFGHQARNNSAASLWPERDDALSREALIAERVSLNRRLKLRHRGDRDANEGAYTKRRHQSEPTGNESKRRRFFLSCYRGRLRTSDSTSSHRCLRGLSGPGSEPVSSHGRIKQKNALKVMRGLRLRNVGNRGQRWSLEPFLRSESHPVFVQPVKEYVMRRLALFRPRSRDHSSTSASSEGAGKRPNYQRAASSTSLDSIQLSRRTPVMTMIQGSRTSLGHLASDADALANAPAGRERILTNAEASQGSISHFQTTSESGPLIAIECSGEDLPENTNCLTPIERVPRYFLHSPELGQIRNRASTSGTIVYDPPLIAEASPNSKTIASDGSTSSGMSSGIRSPRILQEEAIVRASEQHSEPA